jgi:hypothetical protein
MGFKLPGKSITSGTSAHRSALKMVAEQRAASALKATASPVKKDWATASKNDPNLADYVAKRKTLEKGSDEWKRNQNKINKAYGVSKRYEVADEPTQEIKEETTVTKVEPKAEEEVKPTKKETIKKEKKDVKDVRKQSRINILEEKKDVAEAKGKTRRTKRLEIKIERKKSRLDGDKSTNITRRDQRKKRRQERKDERMAKKGYVKKEEVKTPDSPKTSDSPAAKKETKPAKSKQTITKKTKTTGGGSNVMVQQK